MYLDKPSSKVAVIAAAMDCELGENPLWDAERACVYWTDITGGKLFRWDILSGNPQTIYRGLPVGGFTLQTNGELLLFRINDIASLLRNGEVISRRSVEDPGIERFNDVIADFNGRVFVGTIGTSSESGGLYRLERDGSMEKLFGGSGCSNGMGFSPDLKTFYWTCSSSRQIFRFEYDPDSGRIGGRQLFYKAGEDEGIPDGLTVDSAGDIWSARWGKGAIVRHSADGAVLETIFLPVKNVTSVCFGGPVLKDLFITSAKDMHRAEPMAGSLFVVKCDVAGLYEHRSQINFNNPCS